MPTLSIIIVSFNTREMTLECLRSVFKETKKHSFEIIVLDNASSDGSAEAISNGFSDRINFIPSNKNHGFAVANNIASTTAKGDFLLLLNPDTVVLDGAIDRIADFALANPNSGIWGGRTVFPDGSPNPASCWSKQTIWSLFCLSFGLTPAFRRTTFFNPEGLGGWDREGNRFVDIVSGCFFLIEKGLWKKLGGFNELFFMYGEEADLCLRAKQIGGKPMVTSQALIVHYGGASEKVKADKMVRLIKAKMLLISEHFHPWLKDLGHFLLAMWPKGRCLAFQVLAKFGIVSSESYEVWREINNRKKEWIA